MKDDRPPFTAATQGAMTSAARARGSKAAVQPAYSRDDAASDGLAARDRDRRFVYGRKDIGVAIVAAALMSAIFYFAPLIAALPVIIILSELFLRKERLALSALVLTVSYIIVAVGLARSDVSAFVPQSLEVIFPGTWFFIGNAIFTVVIALYSWRYPVPLALAVAYSAAMVMLTTLPLAAYWVIIGGDIFRYDYRMLSALTVFIAALSLFSLAMRYDRSDRYRLTRRTDIAFWLHAAAAPALLATGIYLIATVQNGFGITPNTKVVPVSPWDCLAVVVASTFLGILIDRRAFVMSWVVAMFVVVVDLGTQGKIGNTATIYAGLLLTSLIIGVPGLGWIYLRRLIMAILPKTLARQLPPVR